MLPSVKLVKAMLDQTARAGRELVYVAYENGSHTVFELGPLGGAFPVDMPSVRFVLHTHPLPRFTPSAADIVTAYRISRAKGAPTPLFTASRVGDRLVVYEIKVSPDADIESLLRELGPIEAAAAVNAEAASRAQHCRMVSRRDVTITRFVLRPY